MLETRLAARLLQKKSRLDALLPLPQAAVARLNEQLTVEWIYNSNAIEGNTLTLRETKLILETGLTIGGKSLREHFEVINHRDAIRYVENLVSGREPLTVFHVRQIHGLVLANIDDESAGRYRELGVRIAGSAHQPPDAWQVPQLMDDWQQWLQNTAHSQPVVAWAALAHHRLTAIHPFLDGNGRTARLVMNLLLMQQGYPPTIILRANRRHYYRVLARADAGAEAALVNFVGRAAERSLTIFLEACTPQVAPVPVQESWIPLREAALGTPYSQEYLSLLARTGKLEAIKRGRTWHTTHRALEAYRHSVEDG